jgi:hypothetical protein
MTKAFSHTSMYVLYSSTASNSLLLILLLLLLLLLVLLLLINRLVSTLSSPQLLFDNRFDNSLLHIVLLCLCADSASSSCYLL